MNSDYDNYIDKAGMKQDSTGKNTQGKAKEVPILPCRRLGLATSHGSNNAVYNTWFYGRRISESGFAWCRAFVGTVSASLTGPFRRPSAARAPFLITGVGVCSIIPSMYWCSIPFQAGVQKQGTF